MRTAALLQWEGEELQGDLEVTVIFNAYEISVKATLFKSSLGQPSLLDPHHSREATRQ